MTNTTTNQIIVQDDEEYFYSVSTYEMTNVLGSVIATLREYTLTRIDSASELQPYKLYKTKEGNWYEINASTPSHENSILRKLKTAIDMLENPVEI